MKVLVASQDVRVRRALSRLLELDGNRIVDTTDAPGLLGDRDAEFGPDLVVLELDQPAGAQDLRVVEDLARRGRAVIAVCSRSTACTAVLAAGALACLDKDADFADRLAQAVRAVATLRTPEPEPPA